MRACSEIDLSAKIGYLQNFFYYLRWRSALVLFVRYCFIGYEICIAPLVLHFFQSLCFRTADTTLLRFAIPCVVTSLLSRLLDMYDTWSLSLVFSIPSTEGTSSTEVSHSDRRHPKVASLKFSIIYYIVLFEQERDRAKIRRHSVLDSSVAKTNTALM